MGNLIYNGITLAEWNALSPLGKRLVEKPKTSMPGVFKEEYLSEVLKGRYSDNSIIKLMSREPSK